MMESMYNVPSPTDAIGSPSVSRLFTDRVPKSKESVQTVHTPCLLRLADEDVLEAGRVVVAKPVIRGNKR